MKRQIRRGAFESNSSSCHSLTMCSESDYDRWKNGEVYLCTDSCWGYPENNKPKEGCFYTKEQVISFVKSGKFIPQMTDWHDDKKVREYLREYGWCDYNYFLDYYDNNYETFEDKYVTSNGDTVVAFGYYGFD